MTDMQPDLRLIACDYETHAGAILEIFNEAIVNSTALYDYQPRDRHSMSAWFEAKAAGRYPVIGAVDQPGNLLGFESYGIFRAWPDHRNHW